MGSHIWDSPTPRSIATGSGHIGWQAVFMGIGSNLFFKNKLVSGCLIIVISASIACLISVASGMLKNTRKQSLRFEGVGIRMFLSTAVDFVQ